VELQQVSEKTGGNMPGTGVVEMIGDWRALARARNGNSRQLISVVWFLALFAGMGPRAVFALNPIYEYTVVAREGMTTPAGERVLGIKPEVSINERGWMVFVADMDPGSNLIVARSTDEMRNISRSRDDRQFTFPQINNQNVVVARELMAGQGVIRTWRAANPGDSSIIASTTLSPFSQLTVPTLGNTDLPNDKPLVGFLGRVEDLPFAFYANDTGRRDVQDLISNLAGDSLASFRAMTASSQRRTFVAQYRTPADQGRLVVFEDVDDLGFWWDDALIATTAGADYWIWLGVSPGISDSGKVVAFGGDHITNGAGIYMATTEGRFSAGFELKRVIGERDVIAYDDAAQPITLSAFDMVNRVGVLHEELGRAGLADDVITLAFVAKPSSASGANRRIPGRPLLFSGELGLWTLRVDLETNLTAPHLLQVHAATPQAVVQVGDVLDGSTVKSVALYDPLSLPLLEPRGTPRIPSRGDHYLAFTVDTDAGVKAVRAARLDTDGDGLADHWEKSGVDMDHDGRVDLNLPQMGANPMRRDIFLEIDWLPPRIAGGIRPWRNEPAPGVTRRLARMFEEAPVANPDGSRGITLHIDAGPRRDANDFPYSVNMGSRRSLLDGGDLIGGTSDPRERLEVVFLGQTNQYINITNVPFRAMYEVKREYFGVRDKGARELAFKYTVLGDFDEMFWNNLNQAIQYRVAAATSNTVQTTTALNAGLKSGHLIKVFSGRGSGQVRTIDGFLAFDTIQVRGNWETIPDATSWIIVIDGCGGWAEMVSRPGPDHHTRPANDFLVTLGGYGVNEGAWLANNEVQWTTLAHELGHTMGLRHGGVDHNAYRTNYMSLMRYVRPRPPSYSGALDPVFDDWAYLKFDFQNTGYILGNSYRLYPFKADTANPPDLTVTEYEALTGAPIDLKLPRVEILSPAAGSTLDLGSSISVTVRAQDDVRVDDVVLFFDIDGDGQWQSGTEEVPAVPAGNSIYSAIFRNITGPFGARKILAIAADPSRNEGAAAISVLAGKDAGGGSILRTATGVFAAQPAASSGGKRASAAIGPIQVPGSGRLVVTVKASPSVGASAGGTNRYNSTVAALQFEGEEVDASPVCTPSAVDPSLCSVYWNVPSAGSLTLELAGPAFYSAAGAFVGSPAQHYTVTIGFEAVDVTAPAIELRSPDADAAIGLGEPLLVQARVTDDYGVASVEVAFDTNGNGQTDDSGETVLATSRGGGVYEALFDRVAGEAGIRLIRIAARDTSDRVTRASGFVEVRAPDTVAPTIRILTPEPGAAIHRGTNLTVQIEAGDDLEMRSVSVAFDTNGDGTPSGANEIVTATQTGPFNYQAGFVDVEGPSGPRMVTATAVDSSGNSARADVPITVGGVAPVTRTMLTQSGVIPAQGSQWSGGKRQVIEFDPITLPSAGTVSFIVTATPNCRQTTENIPRYDPCVDLGVLNGKEFKTVQTWNPAGSDPAVSTNTFVATQGGMLDFRMLGSGVFNIWGEFSGSPMQSYTLEIRFVSVDNVDPVLAITAPMRGAGVSAGAPLTVDLAAADNVEVASVLAFFDVNGDGDTEDSGETQAARLVGGQVYRAAFADVAGPPGPRILEALATDTSLNTASQSITVGVGGAGVGERLLFSTGGSITNIGRRQTLRFSPLAIPGVGRITFRVAATPPTRQSLENLTRYDPAVWEVRFNGQTVKLAPNANPPGSDPAICASIWDSPGPGSLEFEVRGPAEFNIWGEFTGHPLQNYTVEVLYLPGPIINAVNPATGSVAGGDLVRVTGAGFGYNALVLFGEVAAQDVVRNSAEELTCRTPPGVVGPVAVTVLNSDSEGQPWNYGAPYALFGRLANGFAYGAPSGPVARGAERLLGTFHGYFAAVGAEESQREESHPLTIPGPGRLRFEAWAFVPILNPLRGPFENPDDLTYHNETTAVRAVAAGDGRTYNPTVQTTDISYPYGPVVSDATCVVTGGAGGAGRFTVKGPARWNAFWRQFGEYEMLSAPAQHWSLAVWHAPTPSLTSLNPVGGSTGGGTWVTLTGTGFAEGIQVRFGGQLGTDLQMISSNTLICRTPPGLQGVVDVEIELLEMKSTLARGFTVASFEILDFIYPEFQGLPATIHAWTELGKVYQLQRSLDLKNEAGWTNVGGWISGVGGSQAFPDPAPPTRFGHAFYRLVERAQ